MLARVATVLSKRFGEDQHNLRDKYELYHTWNLIISNELAMLRSRAGKTRDCKTCGHQSLLLAVMLWQEKLSAHTASCGKYIEID